MDLDLPEDSMMKYKLLIEELKEALQDEIDFLHYHMGNTLEDEFMFKASGRSQACKDILANIKELEEKYNEIKI